MNRERIVKIWNDKSLEHNMDRKKNKDIVVRISIKKKKEYLLQYLPM